MITKKLIPTACYHSIYEIPYEELYEKGVRLILTDLDNTLISYADKLPNFELFMWKEKLEKLGFEIVICSNSRKTRVDAFATAFGVKYNKFSTKPLKRGVKHCLNKIVSKKYMNSEIILLGDQLMTDVLVANRMHIGAYFIQAIDKSTEHTPTRFNRKIERFFLKKMKKKFPEEYEKIKEYTENKNDNKEM